MVFKIKLIWLVIMISHQISIVNSVLPPWPDPGKTIVGPTMCGKNVNQCCENNGDGPYCCTYPTYDSITFTPICNGVIDVPCTFDP